MHGGPAQSQPNGSGGAATGRAVWSAAEVAAQSGLAVASVMELLPFQGGERPTDTQVPAYDEHSVLRARLALLMRQQAVADRWIRSCLKGAHPPSLLDDLTQWQAIPARAGGAR